MWGGFDLASIASEVTSLTDAITNDLSQGKVDFDSLQADLDPATKDQKARSDAIAAKDDHAPDGVAGGPSASSAAPGGGAEDAATAAVDTKTKPVDATPSTRLDVAASAPASLASSGFFETMAATTSLLSAGPPAGSGAKQTSDADDENASSLRASLDECRATLASESAQRKALQEMVRESAAAQVKLEEDLATSKARESGDGKSADDTLRNQIGELKAALKEASNAVERATTAESSAVARCKR